MIWLIIRVQIKNKTWWEENKKMCKEIGEAKDKRIKKDLQGESNRVRQG